MDWEHGNVHGVQEYAANPRKGGAPPATCFGSLENPDFPPAWHQAEKSKRKPTIRPAGIKKNGSTIWRGRQKNPIQLYPRCAWIFAACATPRGDAALSCVGGTTADADRAQGARCIFEFEETCAHGTRTGRGHGRFPTEEARAHCGLVDGLHLRDAGVPPDSGNGVRTIGKGVGTVGKVVGTVGMGVGTVGEGVGTVGNAAGPSGRGSGPWGRGSGPSGRGSGPSGRWSGPSGTALPRALPASPRPPTSAPGRTQPGCILIPVATDPHVGDSNPFAVRGTRRADAAAVAVRGPWSRAGCSVHSVLSGGRSRSTNAGILLNSGSEVAKMVKTRSGTRIPIVRGSNGRFDSVNGGGTSTYTKSPLHVVGTMDAPGGGTAPLAGPCSGGWGGRESPREKRQRTRTGRGPDAGRTIEFEETDADRTRTGRGRGRFSQAGLGPKTKTARRASAPLRRVPRARGCARHRSSFPTSIAGHPQGCNKKRFFCWKAKQKRGKQYNRGIRRKAKKNKDEKRGA
eukprot:gene23151-biopygen1237